MLYNYTLNGNFGSLAKVILNLMRFFDIFNKIIKINHFLLISFLYLYLFNGDWGLGIGDWGLGSGEWAQSPIPNPQSPIPNFNENIIIF